MPATLQATDAQTSQYRDAQIKCNDYLRALSFAFPDITLIRIPTPRNFLEARYVQNSVSACKQDTVRLGMRME